MTQVALGSMAAPGIEPRRRTKRRLKGAGWFTYVLLGVTTFLFLLPFYYMIVVGSRTMSEINQVPPPLTPGGNLWHNIRAALEQQNIGKAIVNSLIVSGSQMPGSPPITVHCSSAAVLKNSGSAAPSNWSNRTVPPR